ncbi:predicted protein [Streptomyces filamentosus NRRL 15998]|uniref:Predicted protein n=1 Tax=Streptomyces filamentosus NRRL 15998 TaxID=457431 RepID=D6AUH3_STRFL|nr:predicted protein [Streptomyces filamentosus NRRL 15998]
MSSGVTREEGGVELPGPLSPSASWSLRFMGASYPGNKAGHAERKRRFEPIKPGDLDPLPVVDVRL